MSWIPLLPFLNRVIDEIEPGNLSDTTLSNLHSICPEKVILAALDIIDRDNIIHYVTPWGHEEYQVLGSSGSYSVMLDIVGSTTVPFSCTCPAFVYSVLVNQTHLVCKHTLATLIARQLKQCIERFTNLNDLEELFRQQFPLGQGSPDVDNINRMELVNLPAVDSGMSMMLEQEM